MGDRHNDPLRADFGRQLKLELHGKLGKLILDRDSSVSATYGRQGRRCRRLLTALSMSGLSFLSLFQHPPCIITIRVRHDGARNLVPETRRAAGFIRMGHEKRTR